MRPKLYYVTQFTPVNKKRAVSKVVGFVSVFGWESAEKKALEKYPTLERIQIHEARPRR